VTPDGIRPERSLVRERKKHATEKRVKEKSAPSFPPSKSRQTSKSSTSATLRFSPAWSTLMSTINEPGRTEWEGFETATRAAAAGGYTTLVDMPLNCLPPTATVAALTTKRKAAQGKCRVDWLPWGGVKSATTSRNRSPRRGGFPVSSVF